MCSLFSPVLADIVMDDLEKDKLSNLDFEVPVYFRYVDDIFIVVPNTHVDHILQIFNTNPLNIEFTLEKEFNRAVNFLDVTITKKQNKELSSNWYRKPNGSGRYLNFNSHHPLRYTKSVINNLVDRAVLLSDKEFQKNNLRLIINTLEENDYRHSFVQVIMNQRLLTLKEKTRLGSNQVDIDTENIPYIGIPYVEGLSEKISGILNSYNINTTFKNDKNLKMIFKSTKDKILKEQSSNIVYSVPCKGNDCKAIYIGQTKRFLENGLKEHKNNFKESPNK